MNIKLPTVSVSLKSFNIAMPKMSMPSYFKRTAKPEPKPVDVALTDAELAAVLLNEMKHSIARFNKLVSL